MGEFINSFPGYEFKEVEGCKGPQNIYRGTNLGFGGYVYYEEGMYTDVALLDIQSLHPASIISLNKFGKYTQKYKELRDLRVAIKEHNFEKARSLLGGSVAKYLENEDDADQLAQAAKLILNSTFGFCFANFDNPFRDSRDKNDIVALKGSLFMRTLQDEVTSRGFTVAHIKTDSIKVPNATKEIVEFIKEFAKPYGYIFEHEATYDRMCLVNGSTYIAKYASPEKCEQLYGYVPKDNRKHPNQWTATAKQFQVPYVFKTLFSKEPIEFDDLCETNEVQSPSAIYLDMNEYLPEGEHNRRFIGRVGRFCPIKPECGGGELVRNAVGKDGNVKYDSVTGTKGYRWLEAELVKELGKEDDIDRSYYDEMVQAAIYGSGRGASRKPGISDFGDFEWFVSDEPAENFKPMSHEAHPVYNPFDDVTTEDVDVPWYDDDPAELFMKR